MTSERWSIESSFWKTPQGRFIIGLWIFAVGIVLAVIFFADSRERSGKGREALERLREGTVEIIADGVEKGVRRASGEKE